MAADLSRARVAILGCGAVGTAFARELVDRKRFSGRVPFRGELVLWSRSRASVRRCLAALAAMSPRSADRVAVAPGLQSAVLGADVVLVCVTDRALAETTLRAARVAVQQRQAPVFLVSSGYQPLAPLRARLDRRIALGRLHPLKPVLPWSKVHGVTRLWGATAVEGDLRARRAAHALLRHYAGVALELRPGQSVAYHAGASLLGGGIVALSALAEDLMSSAVRSPRRLHAALWKFASNNIDNCLHRTPALALTGPLARGAEATVRGHLRAMGRRPRARAAYAVLGEVMLDLARARGSLDAASERRLRQLLRSIRR